MHSIKQIDVSRETFKYVDNLISEKEQLLDKYVNHLFWWNKRINLVSRNVSRETIWHHMQHSLLISAFKPFKSSNFIVDAGTGGGLPGIPLAIAHPEKRFVLNDVMAKKILAVKQISRDLGLQNVAFRSASVADVQTDASTLLVSKHAFKIKKMVEYISASPWKTAIFYKSTNIKEELEGVNKALDIKVYDLGSNNEDSFYEGKGLIVVNKKKRYL